MLKPWAYLLRERTLPLPFPHELLALPASLTAHSEILVKASRAGSRMLENTLYAGYYGGRHGAG